MTYLPANALHDEAAFKDVVETAHQLNQTDATGEAQSMTKELWNALEQTKLASTSPQTAAAYQDILVYLQFVAFPVLSDTARQNLFRDHLVLGMTTDVDIKTKLELTFLLYGDDELGRPLRRQLALALADNNELIGTQPLVIQEAPDSLSPSVQHWLADFLRHVRTGQPASALDIANYFNDSVNAKRLSPDERRLLEQVLSLYVYMVNPPQLAVPTGHAEASVRTTSAAGAVPSTDFRSALLQTLFEESQAEEAVFAEEQRLMSGGKYDRARIHKALWTGRSGGQRATVEAALFLMARAGELAQVLTRDTVAQQLLEQEVLPAILPALKAQRSSVTLDQLVADFRRTPGRPVYLKLFLEFILHQVHQGESGTAARAGMRLADLLFHQGFTEAGGMAYYDADSGQYRWVDTGLDSQGVPVLSDT